MFKAVYHVTSSQDLFVILMVGYRPPLVEAKEMPISFSTSEGVATEGVTWTT